MNKSLDKYLKMRYRAGARGEDGFADCWGLMRLVRHEVYGRPLLPEYAGTSRENRDLMREITRVEAPLLDEVGPTPGAAAAVVFRGVCVHVATVVESGFVLDVRGDGQRPGLVRISDFVKKWTTPTRRVIFYD